MNQWRWADPAWRERVADDRSALLREALRRAIHLRDGLAEGQASATEAVMLVDVLNEACALFGAGGDDIWDLP
jgi:hypothetical protein